MARSGWKRLGTSSFVINSGIEVLMKPIRFSVLLTSRRPKSGFGFELAILMKFRKSSMASPADECRYQGEAGTAAFCWNVRPGMTAINTGANMGHSSLLAARLVS